MSNSMPVVNQNLVQGILLDSPAAQPALGFEEIARGFASIIEHSDPCFAIGIFGGWGSGKTTLMKAIKERLTAESLVSVDFNAWRFEREPQLLAPLLDTVRAAVASWAERPNRDREKRDKVRESAARIGNVVRALATGLSVKAGLPGAVSLSYDVRAALDALPGNDESTGAQSLYFAAFQELEKAFREFQAGGIRRVVIFVDDLDRCLPENALQVLESMKLFFDLEGFIFVVGTDQGVLEQALQVKYSRLATELSAAPESSPIAPARGLGWEYTKKIFQVPYWLPEVREQHLDALLKSMLGGDKENIEENGLREMIRPYITHIAVEGLVNPREVKLFINAYIVQKAIDRNLASGHALALLVFAFRPDWRMLYAEILKDPDKFQYALRKYIDGEKDALKSLSPQLEVVHPDSLAKFLDSEQARPLAEGSLEDPLASLQSATSGGPWMLRALSLADHMRAQINRARAGSPGDPIRVLEAALEAIQDQTMEMEAFLNSSAPPQVRDAVLAIRATAARAEFALRDPGLNRARAEKALKDLEDAIRWIRPNAWASFQL